MASNPLLSVLGSPTSVAVSSRRAPLRDPASPARSAGIGPSLRAFIRGWWLPEPWLGRLRAVGPMREYAEVVLVVALVTILGWYAPFSYRSLGHIYLLAVIVLCVRVGRGPVFFAAVVSALAWNYVIMPPRFSFSVLHGEDGLILGTYFVVALSAGHLLTERERLREASERAKIAAESGRLHRTLLDSVSHELKTPLAVLRSATEKVETEDPRRRDAVLGEIRAAVNRLDRLVGNLLHQTRLQAGAVRPALAACDVRDLIATARRSAADLLLGRPITLELPDELPLAQVDAALIEQALSNVLLNAALHTPAGTPILITAGAAGRDRVFICIADRGAGIPPEIRGQLFQKFQRGPGAKPGGVGLGLSIVHGFVAANGGEVVVDDHPGGGARFTLFLPLAPHAEVPRE